jgi:putative ABC transport system permease protein
MIRQITIVTLAALRRLPSRLPMSLVVVAGVAGVAFVVMALFAMADGLERSLADAGEPDRVIVLGRGSNSEINGAITRDQAAVIADLPGIRAAATPDGRQLPLASGEIYASANLQRSRDGARAGLPLRGVSEAAFRVRPEVRVVAGRRFEPGRFELIAGVGAARVFAGLDIGETVSIKGTDWRVVGHFEAGGSGVESEAWIDVDAMAGVFGRGPFLQSVRVRLAGPEALAVLAAAIEDDRRLSVGLFGERDYYGTHSESATAVTRMVGMAAGAIMALGAVFGALNALLAAVQSRTREITVLRAIGYPALPVVASVVVESLVLCLAGAAAGCAAAWVLFDGRGTSSIGATYTEVAFRFAMSAELVLAAGGVAVVIGLVGSILPALRVVRYRIVDGLRAAR